MAAERGQPDAQSLQAKHAAADFAGALPLSEPAAEIVLAAHGIVKEYPGTVALKGIDFEVHRGKVNVLIGENGAGKSTLMKILAGVEEPTRGSLSLDGRPIHLRSTTDAMRHGITMVHQELNLLPNLNVAENIFAGRELRNRLGWVDQGRQAEDSRCALERLGSAVGARTLIEDISLGDQQVVELARALAQKASVLILDEPTSALSVAEVEMLFRIVEELKQQGVSIIYISHRLDELLRIGDVFTVLRDGLVAGVCMRGEADHRWIVERMTGRSDARPDARSCCVGADAACLEVRDVTLARVMPDGTRRELLSDVAFHARAGEVLGIFGLLGSGRTELLETLAGLRPRFSGSVLLNGREVSLDSPGAAMRQGVMLIPEDRKCDGLMLDLSIRENIAAAGVKRATTWGFLRGGRELASIRAVAARLHLKAADLDLPVSSLSGGSQQKVLLARCILRSPRVLLLDEPTRGVDVGSKAEIYAILRQLAADGIVVIFTSSEMQEIHALADRVMVLSRGSNRLEQTADSLSEAEMLAAAMPMLHTPGEGGRPHA